MQTMGEDKEEPPTTHHPAPPHSALAPCPSRAPPTPNPQWVPKQYRWDEKPRETVGQWTAQMGKHSSGMASGTRRPSRAKGDGGEKMPGDRRCLRKTTHDEHSSWPSASGHLAIPAPSTCAS